MKTKALERAKKLCSEYTKKQLAEKLVKTEATDMINEMQLQAQITFLTDQKNTLIRDNEFKQGEIEGMRNCENCFNSVGKPWGLECKFEVRTADFNAPYKRDKSDECHMNNLKHWQKQN